MGAERAVLIETDGREWDPIATAAAIVEAIRAGGVQFDLLLFGMESADTGGYQVGVRVAHALDLPCVTGVKALTVGGATAVARREAGGGWEEYEVALPAVITVKEGINLPRYPPLMGRLKAKKKTIERHQPAWPGSGLEKVQLKLPPQTVSQVEILGEGPQAAARAVELFHKLGVV
jgi:electron transfer flavoprotein beta subunit